ncbi:MAG: hypothetical protein AB7I18_08710 [Candidatus Berkiella sp.]
MFEFLQKDTFPWWYTPLKWGLPIGLAGMTGIGAGLMLTGSVGMPAFFGMLKWAPAFYASLEGFSAIAVLGAVTAGLASTVGVLSAFLLRGTLLFPLAESIAMNSQHSQQKSQEVFAQEKSTLEKRCDAAEEALRQTDNRLTTVTTQFNQLRGAYDAHEKRHGKTSSKAAAANDSAKPAEEALGKGTKLKV